MAYGGAAVTTSSSSAEDPCAPVSVRRRRRTSTTAQIDRRSQKRDGAELDRHRCAAERGGRIQEASAAPIRRSSRATTIAPRIMAVSRFSTKSDPVTSCTIGVDANRATNRHAAVGETQRRSTVYSIAEQHAAER